MRHFSRILMLVVILAAAAAGVEHWRGQHMLQRWKAQTESLVPQKLWPPASESSRQHLAQLNLAAAQLRGSLGPFGGMMQPVIWAGPGLARRGSQEPALPCDIPGSPRKTWQDLEQAMRQTAPALRNLRQLMNEIPSGVDYDIRANLEKSLLPSYVSSRVAAQSLHAAALFELHQRNLPGALDNLVALAHAPRIRAKDPSLVSYMIRIAVVGLVDSACWDALQADGWTDQQLALLQQACQDAPQISQLPAVYQAEQAVRIHDHQWFRSHGYEEWFQRHEDLLVSFGVTRATLRGSKAAYHWNRYVRHPAWSVAWADQELALYLKSTEPEAAAIRQAARQGSWQSLHDDLGAVRVRYVPPAAAWRFYEALPLRDFLSATIGGPAIDKTWPYADFSRAWQVAFRNLTHHNLLLAAIAIKRYELRHGNPPPALFSLCPEFLDAVPLDLMDGRPLRYRVNPDNSYTLYSVGLDGRDGGGEPAASDSDKTTGFDSLNGKDFVWPRLAASRK